MLYFAAVTSKYLELPGILIQNNREEVNHLAWKVE